jgi:hypothetical protein
VNRCIIHSNKTTECREVVLEEVAWEDTEVTTNRTEEVQVDKETTIKVEDNNI